MITIESISKTFRMGSARVRALDSVSLSIPTGEMVVVYGPSGSGKSTLLHMVGAMDAPDSGAIWMDDTDITQYTCGQATRYRAEKIGFIFQSFNLVPSLSVYENVIIPMRLKAQQFEKDAIMEILDKVGLSTHVKHKPGQLSGGQQQRVAIARALAHNPPYIIADEPTANLDSKTSDMIIDVLKKCNAEFGNTVLIASHDEAVKKSVVRRIGMIDGKVTE